MSFLINRLRITAAGTVAFDERFYRGINVLEGENSTGKSTLFKILYHGIGGTVPQRQWSDAALACSRVYVEVGIGAAVLTLSRKIVSTGLPAVLIYDGTMEQGLAQPIDQWLEYPYSRSASGQSYSQLVFSMLDMPEAFSETGDFMTLNQFLRAHYADQESPNTTILRYEDQFDKPATREAIGTFILGGVDHNLSQTEAALRDAEKAYNQALASVASGNALLGADYSELSLSGIAAWQARLLKEIEEVEFESQSLQRATLRPFEANDIDRTRIVDLTTAIVALKGELSDRTASRSELALEAQDSEMFLSTLRQRALAISQALNAADNLGEIWLDACPACGAPVEHSEAEDHCYLCKSEDKRGVPTARYLSLLNSTQAQIEQSNRIQKTRATHLEDLTRQIESIQEEIRQRSVDLENQRATVSTEVQSRLSTLQSRLGFLKSEMERANRDKKVVERLQAFREERDRLEILVTELQQKIQNIRNGVNLRLAGAMSAVSSETARFLDADMDRQVEFHQNPHVELDYRNNSFSIDGKKAFSASSTSYLRNSIFLGTLFASKRVATMRHLEMLMLENLEDKGMEPARYHNLHRNIVERSGTLEGAWQILIATADLAPDIRDAVSFIGRKYTHESKTLNLPDEIGAD